MKKQITTSTVNSPSQKPSLSASFNLPFHTRFTKNTLACSPGPGYTGYSVHAESQEVNLEESCPLWMYTGPPPQRIHVSRTADLLNYRAL